MQVFFPQYCAALLYIQAAINKSNALTNEKWKISGLCSCRKTVRSTANHFVWPDLNDWSYLCTHCTWMCFGGVALEGGGWDFFSSTRVLLYGGHEQTSVCFGCSSSSSRYFVLNWVWSADDFVHIRWTEAASHLSSFRLFKECVGQKKMKYDCRWRYLILTHTQSAVCFLRISEMLVCLRTVFTFLAVWTQRRHRKNKTRWRKYTPKLRTHSAAVWTSRKNKPGGRSAALVVRFLMAKEDGLCILLLSHILQFFLEEPAAPPRLMGFIILAVCLESAHHSQKAEIQC